jgi:hypothetical protein
MSRLNVYADEPLDRHGEKMRPDERVVVHGARGGLGSVAG